jgi:Ca2+-binding EF-hand superfamily protein
MDAEAKAVIKKIFDQIDKDGNGSIDANELKEKLRIPINSGVLQLESVDEIFNRIDVNSDGKIVFDEFIAGIQAIHKFLQ